MKNCQKGKGGKKLWGPNKFNGIVFKLHPFANHHDVHSGSTGVFCFYGPNSETMGLIGLLLWNCNGACRQKFNILVNNFWFDQKCMFSLSLSFSLMNKKSHAVPYISGGYSPPWTRPYINYVRPWFHHGLTWLTVLKKNKKTISAQRFVSEFQQ